MGLLLAAVVGTGAVGATAYVAVSGAPSSTSAPADQEPTAGDGVTTVAGDLVSTITGGTRGVPVLLVPGWLDTSRDLAAMRIRLLGAGWAADHVETITFEEPTGSNRVHAEELARAIDEVLARTGSTEVDIVAHSMGGLAARWYLLGRDDPPVRRVAFIGSPHRGTLSAHLAWGGGREEMMPESPFLDSLNSEAPYPRGVEAITIRTVVDTHIVPGESATLPGVEDFELCCPTHAGLIHDDEVFEIVLDFLERP